MLKPRVFGILAICLLVLSMQSYAYGHSSPEQRDKLIVLNFDDGPRPNVLLSSEEKMIVLTFDGGPKPEVLLGVNGKNGLIAVLESFGVQAHFFMIGAKVDAHPDIARAVSQKGFLIENHSYGHENLVKLFKEKGEAAVVKNLRRTSETIFKTTGLYPKYFRPPYWVANGDVERIVANLGLKIVTGPGRPDINTLDYDDYEKKRPSESLVKRVKKIIAYSEKEGMYKHVLVFHELPITVEALKELIPYFLAQGYRFGDLDEFFGTSAQNQKPLALTPAKQPIKAAYLAVDYLYNQKKISDIEKLIEETELNAVVIDFKVGKVYADEYMQSLVRRFRSKGTYVIGRQVVFQDSYLVEKRPHLAIRDKSGKLCYSGSKEWGRYWVDMASYEVLEYNISIAKQGVDLGFDEINFDYIRFPSDFGSNCKLRENVAYPVWKDNFLTGVNREESKYKVMRKFYRGISSVTKSYAAEKGREIMLSIDIYGEVFVNGAEPGIGQKLSDIAEFFDVISPMAYPSHYKCSMFGVKDPNAYPYITYVGTLNPGLKILLRLGFAGEVRPWVQDFSLANIYGCGPHIKYGPEEVRAQIVAAKALGVNGFMLWNGSSNYTKKALLLKE